MMDELKRISITEEESLYLERLWYEFQGYLTLITQFTSDGPYVPGLLRFEKVLDSYLEAFAAYNMAWQALAGKHIPEYMHDDNHKMYVDFSFIEIVVVKRGESINECKICKQGN